MVLLVRTHVSSPPRRRYGRLDDMLLICGTNVYPSQIQRSLLEVPGTGVEFKIVLEKKGALDHTSVLVERDPAVAPADIDHFVAELRERVRHKLKNDTAVNFEVDIRLRTRSNGRFRRPSASTIAGQSIGRPIIEGVREVGHSNANPALFSSRPVLAQPAGRYPACMDAPFDARGISERYDA